jgi:hypothetical protein
MPVAVVKEIGGGKTAVLDPRKEYLAAGHLPAYNDGLRALSSNVEDVMREVSPKVYEQMLTDPEISKCINVLKISVLGDGVDLLPALAETDDDYEAAVIVTEFCEKALRGLKKPLRDTLEQMMDALVFGHKIAEITYRTSTVGGFNGEFLVPDSIKVKDRDVAQFVVDNKMNVIGFVGMNNSVSHNGVTVGGEPTVRTGGNSISIERPTGSANSQIRVGETTDGKATLNGRPILPRDKFMVLTIRGKNEDPRGQSMLRAAFNAWHLKTQIWPEYLRYLLLCAIPLLVGYTPENDTQPEIMRDSQGNPLKDADGRFVQVNQVEALRDALLNARNSEVIAAKGGTKIQEIGAQGAGTPFFKAIEIFDRQMETGILLQTLATSEGVHQNRAAAQTHMSVLDMLVWWLKGVVVDVLVADLLRPLVRFNFGDDALELVPKVSLGDTERREFSTDAEAIATLYKAGYLQPDQLKQTDAMLGLAIRRSVDPLQLIQQLQAAGVPIQAVPPPPQAQAQVQAGPGGGATPVPIAPAGISLPIGQGRADSAQQGAAGERTAARNRGRSATARFPAAGRIRSRVNRRPVNEEAPDNVNVRPAVA